MGVVIYFLAYGCLPYSATNRTEQDLITDILTKEYHYIIHSPVLLDATHPKILYLLTHMLVKNPAKRYSARQLVSYLSSS